MRDYRFEKQPDGTESIATDLHGLDLLNTPILNKGSSFSREERERFGLMGLLPSHVSTIEQQAKRMIDEIHRKRTPLEKFIVLSALQNRNETLFYKILYDHLEELMPVVYTPTVGEACQEFSHIFRKTRGLWITPDHRGNIPQVLKNYPFQDIRLIVVTDNERILGLGDLGAGGIGIPIGKLSLYTVAAGIHPSQTLAISLDVGTDNATLLDDPLYLGWKHARLRGAEYAAFVEEFIQAVKACFPRAILQWEDFKKGNAFTLLERYRDALPSFNDDIQGTAAVSLAGVLSACRISGVPFADQRVLILGAGGAGVGISRLLRSHWLSLGVPAGEIHERLILVDSKGILVQGSAESDEHKAEFAWPAAKLSALGLAPEATLERIVAAFRPTVLLGTSGQPGAFTAAAVRTMAEHAARPILFPLSNPTSHAEATPRDLLDWTEGRALIATGSPFDPVVRDGKTFAISQGNNVYIYPGVGLAAILLGTKRIEDDFFILAATALANLTSQADLDRLTLYPPVARLREISIAIARHICVQKGLSEGETELRLAETVWTPRYPSIIPRT